MDYLLIQNTTHYIMISFNVGTMAQRLYPSPAVNVNWDLPEQHQSFYNLLNKTWKASVSCTSKAPEEFVAPYQPGGTATIICDNWTSRVLNKGEDPVGLGQWTYITLQGKGTKKVTVVTAYNASYTTGGTTNFCQQQRVLTNLHIHHKQVTDANPRKQFILDLQSWLEHQLTQNHEIILAMEANITYYPYITGQAYPLFYKESVPIIDFKHNGLLSTLITTCGIIDPLACQHSSRPFPASHIRGSQRIDFILVSPGIAPAVLTSGSLPFYSIFDSDHRPYYIDIDAKLLFSDSVHDIAPKSHRLLRLHDPRITEKYRTLVHKQFQIHKVYEKLNDLKSHADKATWQPSHTDLYQICNY